MMKSSTKRLCRAGVIAALYVTLTYVFMPFAFGSLQLRPAEALCILPLFFPEAVPALFVGCALSNLTSPYAFYDVLFGSLTTLLAASGTYAVGKLVKRNGLKIILGGMFPVVSNALAIPLVIVFLCDGAQGYATAFAAYTAYAFSLFCTESVWIFGLGTPLFFTLNKIYPALCPAEKRR